MMIDVRQAIANAKEFLMEVADKDFYGTRVAEVEENDRGNWLITLGIQEEMFLTKLTYKVFGIDGETGRVLSMKFLSQPQ